MTAKLPLLQLLFQQQHSKSTSVKQKDKRGDRDQKQDHHFSTFDECDLKLIFSRYATSINGFFFIEYCHFFKRTCYKN